MNARLARLRGRSVFLTGHTGFKGSWLALWLHRLGARVTGYSLRPPTEPSNFAVSRVQEVLAAHHEADLRDGARLEAALRAAAPDVVLHLAAQAIVRESYTTPVDTWEVNVLGTARLLDAVRRLGRPCAVVVITSDKCYENRGQVWGYRESDPMGGHDPYSASKGAVELLTASFRRSFFPPERLGEHHVKLASARAGNVIGGGDWARDRIIVDLVKALARGEPVPVRSPHAVRPWQHVLEPLAGYMTLASEMLASDDPRWCTGWNFGPFPGEDVTVQELVERALRVWGAGSWVDRSDPRAPHEAPFLRLSIDQALWELKWRPRWSVTEALERAVRWYKRYYQAPGADMRAACLEDLAAYEAAGKM